MKPPFQPDDAKLTAYALGELRGADWAEVEQTLAGDAEGQETVEEILQTARLIELELKKQPSPRLSPAHLATIEDHIDRHTRLPYRQLGRFGRRSQGYPYLALAAAACVVGVAMLWLFVAPRNRSQVTISPQNHPATSGSRGPIIVPAPVESLSRWYAAREADIPGFALVETDTAVELPLDPQSASMESLEQDVARGRLPDARSVKPGTVINVLDYATPAVPESIAFAVAVEIAEAPWDASRRVARVTIRTARPGIQPMTPVMGVAAFVHFDPLRVKSYRLIGYLPTQAQGEPIRLDLSADGRCRTLLLEFVPQPEPVQTVTSQTPAIHVRMNWTDAAQQRQTLVAAGPAVSEGPLDSISPDLARALVAAEFESLIREDRSIPDASWARCLRFIELDTDQSENPESANTRFARLIEKCGKIADSRASAGPETSYNPPIPALARR